MKLSSEEVEEIWLRCSELNCLVNHNGEKKPSLSVLLQEVAAGRLHIVTVEALDSVEHKLRNLLTDRRSEDVPEK